MLDPRYKTAGFRSKESAGIAKELLIQEIVTNRQVQTSHDTSIEESVPATSTEAVDPWDAVLIDTEDSEEDTSDESILPVRKQVNEYLKEKRLPLSSDPLNDFWAKADNHSKFSLIAPVVRKYLSAPPASTSVERLFSAAGIVVGDKRLSLKPENVECNLFLKYNIRSLGISSKGDLSQPPEGFVDPNSRVGIPDAVFSHGDTDADEDIYNIDIDISSDEE